MSDMDIVSVTIDRGRHTVLVVDDNPATRYATARVLRAGGFQTAEAASGEEALRRAREGVSAVVLDVHLPDIDGFEVCRRLRATPQTEVLPVVHLSATYVGDRHKVAGLNAGADAYITHPAEPPVLIATIQALIRARLAEESLRGSEAKFRAIYNQARSGIALVDAQGRIVDANPALLKMLDRTADAVLGKEVSSFAPPEWVDFVHGKTVAAPGKAELWTESFPLRDAQGHYVYLEWSMSPHLDTGLRVGAVTDVSDRMLLEQQRQQLLEREQAARVAAEQHSQTKDNFIAVLSHELRNPLNAMLMAVHVLQRKGPAGDLTRGLAVIEQNARAQGRIISDLLDVARINSGKLALEREYADPQALLNASVEGMRPQIDQKQLQVAMDIAGSREPVWVDPTRFQQIFWNIFANAVKFSHPGGRIDVALARESDTLQLTVRDQGVGIAPEFLDSIFDKFSQALRPGDRPSGGLGLGMTIVKQVAELHGGTVHVESDGPDCGTTVRVRLPLLKPPAPHVGAATTQEDQHAEGQLQGLSVLVVEDDTQARDLLSVILRDRGAEVSLAQDYDSAMRALGTGRFDALVSDIGLPGKDGYALVRALRAREQASSPQAHMFAVAVTAFGRPEDRAMAKDAGFDAHVAKPLHPKELLDWLARLRAR